MSIQTVHSTDPYYVSPILGNGEVVTTVGPTGYHDDLGPPHEHPNRTFVWAGRRMNTPTHALVRFGKVQRSLILNGKSTQDDSWTQSLDYDTATLTSRLNHNHVTETTTTQICHTENIAIFHTTFHNQSSVAVNLQLKFSYQFPIAPEDSLDFPQRTHFEEGSSKHTSLKSHELQTQAKDDGFSILYHINNQLGEVRIGCYPLQNITLGDTGGEIDHTLTLVPDESYDSWLWVMLSDRRHFTHFPDKARLNSLVVDHERSWHNFWKQSDVIVDNQTLVDFRQTCLYTIRCNASPWSIPPAYLPDYWEGRTFHDELYPFLALLSSGHKELAERVPTFRLNTLPVALSYGGGHGARYPWETLETGEEGGPYGAWMDERFHIGQFVETVWRYYQHTGDKDALERLYPVMRQSTQFFLNDVLVRDEHGILKTRLVTDFDEVIYPVDNGIFTLCSVIRTLESTAQAAAILHIDENDREQWLSYVTELHKALPTDKYYRVADGASHWHIAQMGCIYPFSFDIDSDIAVHTMTELYNALQTERNTKPGSAKSYDNTHWMWVASMVATGFFYQGRGDEGYTLLTKILNSCGPFLSSNEQQRLRTNEDLAQQYRLPWFTTSAGAFVYALNSIFVQVLDGETTLFKGLPSHMKHAHCGGLLASDGVRLSATIQNGQLKDMILGTDMAKSWTFCLPEVIAVTCGLQGQIDSNSYVHVTVQLDVGDNIIL